MIEIQNASLVKYGQKLFEQLNWKIEKGEHWVIRGNNGSGKTQILEILAGKAQLSEGKVSYDFIHAQDWNTYFEALRKCICYIPAHAAHALLKKYDNLFYQQRYYASFNESIPLVKDVLEGKDAFLEELQLPESFSIKHLLDLPLSRLSNGQFKKVLIIQHLIKAKPQLLLLDYPFEGLDYESRQHLSDFVDHLILEKKIQVILTDHYHDLPQRINRELLLDNFKIQKKGEIKKVESTPKTSKSKVNQIEKDSEVMIEMRSLNIQYGEKLILKDFNWKVHQGDRWALIGKNGSGKTTLFSLIYADHPLAYSQPVFLFGKRRGSGESIWDIKKRINYLGPELISYMQPKAIRISGKEYILNQHKLKDTTQLNSLVDYFQAEAFISKPVHQLSSGQLQLLLLISCFIEDKELILLDEPFQFLAPQQKTLVSQYLQKYLDKNKTLILVTHYTEDINQWSEQILKI